MSLEEKVMIASDKTLKDCCELTKSYEDNSTKVNNTNKLENQTAYVTPEMYGALGDGITDDSNAVKNMFLSKKRCNYAK